ncbi:protein of unknown function [Burkholderia multivorans]
MLNRLMKLGGRAKYEHVLRYGQPGPRPPRCTPMAEADPFPPFNLSRFRRQFLRYNGHSVGHIDSQVLIFCRHIDAPGGGSNLGRLCSTNTKH